MPQLLAAELQVIAARCDGELRALQAAALRAHSDVRRELRRRVADAEADVAAARSGAQEARRWAGELTAAYCLE